jgi:N-methylhydantoinase A
MTVRVGVDVGGTFTKAVACSSTTGEVVARAVVPTTHAQSTGVANGVAEAVSLVTDEVNKGRLGPISLVTHSTTQAVNSLLEGDTSRVGILGIGAQPDIRRARKRTRVGEIRLAPGRTLQTLHSFIDATDGIDKKVVERSIGGLVDQGMEALCVSQAFGVDDARAEEIALNIARSMDLPACAGHELSGLYGLELRTVTGAINASILPTALSTARIVESSVESDLPLLVMRGDGGAADIRAMRRHPLLTAFSGPAASVAGALRYSDAGDGVVVEVGGTSTNISLIRGGRPVLAYVRVLDHVTCVRSIDVRVVGVAGGSLVRIEQRLGRPRIAGMGPRSAHIAGLEYCSFVAPGVLTGATVRVIAPKPGDPEAYTVLEAPNGRRFALTVTCAANALGLVPRGAYAAGDERSARLGFEALGRLLGCDWSTAARKSLESAAETIAVAAASTASELGLDDISVIGLGGGAGALIPSVAKQLGSSWRIPREAEVISSIGDALSLVRVSIERSVTGSAPELSGLCREAEESAIAAGASPASLSVETESIPERSAIRAVATGSVALESGAVPEEPLGDRDDIVLAAKRALGETAAMVAKNPYYWVFAADNGPASSWAVVDRHGSIAHTGAGVLVTGSKQQVISRLPDEVLALVRHFGPVSVAPAVRVLRGPRLIDLSMLSSADAVLEAALEECSNANGETVVAFLSRA